MEGHVFSSRLESSLKLPECVIQRLKCKFFWLFSFVQMWLVMTSRSGEALFVIYLGKKIAVKKKKEKERAAVVSQYWQIGNSIYLYTL